MTDPDSLAGEPEEYRRWVQLGEPEPVAAERYDGEENCFFTYCRYTADYRVKIETTDGRSGTGLVCQRCSLDSRMYIKENEILERDF